MLEKNISQILIYEEFVFFCDDAVLVFAWSWFLFLHTICDSSPLPYCFLHFHSVLIQCLLCMLFISLNMYFINFIDCFFSVRFLLLLSHFDDLGQYVSLVQHQKSFFYFSFHQYRPPLRMVLHVWWE